MVYLNRYLIKIPFNKNQYIYLIARPNPIPKGKYISMSILIYT